MTNSQDPLTINFYGLSLLIEAGQTDELTELIKDLTHVLNNQNEISISRYAQNFGQPFHKSDMNRLYSIYLAGIELLAAVQAEMESRIDDDKSC